MKKKWYSIISLLLAACLLACGQPQPLQTAGTQERTDTLPEQRTEVAVVGAGGAGLTAAYFAREGGKEVVLLEKEASTGESFPINWSPA